MELHDRDGAPLTVRPYEETDFAAVCAVHDLARPDELRGSCDERAFVPLAEESQYELDDFHGSQKWVALDQGRIIGFVGINGSYLSWLYIDPAYYGRGIGRALLRFGLEQIGPKAWTIALDGNTAAIALYQSEGFVIAESFPGSNAGYPCTCLRLVREG